MELVYLWIEDYKNIKKQGFNFSPRFHCEYAEDSNKLTVNENKNYIENFFGDNINVTSIVGKNGSGKSSVLQCIKYYWDKNHFLDRQSLFVYKLNDNYYCVHSSANPPTLNSTEVITFISRDSFFNDKNNHNLGTGWIALNEKVGKNGLNYNRLDGSIVSSMSIEMKNNYFLGDNQFFVPKYIDTYRKAQKVLERIEDIYSFDTLRIRLKNRSSKSINQLAKDNITNEIIKLTKDTEYNFFHQGNYHQDYIYEPIGTEHIDFMQQFGISLLIGFIEFFLKKSKDESFNIVILDQLKALRENVKASSIPVVRFDNILSLIENIDEKLGEKFFKTDNTDQTFQDIIDSVKYLKSLTSLVVKRDKEFCIDINLKKIENDNVIDKIANLLKIFDDDDIMLKHEDSLRMIEIELVNSKTKATYQTLSNGEKQFLRFAIEFLQKLFYIPVYTQNKSYILLADEIDNSLHPVWKKEVIYRIVNLFQTFIADKKEIHIHFIFSTHSPFLLSDIPKQNIIFLDKEVNGNCKVVDGLNTKRQTFGANIHTLLSDSFFMEDGLIGEFAKGKINEILKFYKIIGESKNNDGALTEHRRAYMKKKEKFWEIQSIIGEEYLKQVIKNHLVEIEKILLGNDELKKNEIERLKAEINRLESLE